MNSTNGSFGKRFQIKTDQYLIKNGPSTGIKKVPINSMQNKPKVEPKFQMPSDNMAPIYPKVKVPSFQRAISRETVEEVKNHRNIIPSPMELTPKLEIENEWKRKYEELQNKYDMMLKKYDETRLKSKQLENGFVKEKRKNDDLVIENNKLKSKVKELEEKNENLSKNQQTRTQNRHRHPVEETKTPDENEMLSLQLAMRLEAENQLLNQLSQIATMQMLFERPDRRQAPIHPENPDNIDPDRMTYEELLQLEERIGKVSKGFSKEDIKKIPKLPYRKTPNKPQELCSICYCEYEIGSKVRKLSCRHDYHSKCIKTWLLNEKTCPICKNEVSIPETNQ